jgi:hypothetical protein
MAWGAMGSLAVLTLPALVLAAPKNAAAPASASASAAAQPSAAAAPSAAPAPTDSGTPPVEAAPPAPPVEAAPPPPPPAPAAEATDAGNPDEEAPRKRHKKKRRHQDDDEEVDADSDSEWGTGATDEETEEGAAKTWRLSGTHFILSAERLTSIMSWSRTDTLKITGFSSGGFTTGSQTIELETSGTDVSFMTAGSRGNSYGTPRVAFDGVFANGFTLGGSIGYVVLSGKHEEPSFSNNGSLSTSKHSVDDSTIAVFVFAPRLGVMIAATPTLGIWLRGGITRVSAAEDGDNTTDANGNSVPRSRTVTLVAATLDPQLVFVPVPRVGITVGPVLDIGISGSVDVTDGGTTESQDVKASSYGIAGGLALIF